MFRKISSSSIISAVLSTLMTVATAHNYHIRNIICSGDAEIFINNQLPSLDLERNPQVSVDDGVLIVSSGHHALKLPERIDTFSLHDHCQVRTKNWNGRIQTLVHNSYGDAVMDGFMQIREIYKTGNGRLMAYWLDGPSPLTLNLKKGRTFLAGQVKKLVVDIKGQSHLSAQHLIAQNVLLKSKNQSSAIVHPMQNLTVFSEDQSRVSFVRPIAHSNIVSQGKSAVIMQPLQNT